MYTHGWTPETKKLLDQTDELYARTRPIVEAASTQGALTRAGVFTPAQKLSRIRAGARPSQLSSGRVPGQREAEQANKVLGSSLPEVGPGTAEKLLGSGLTGTMAGIALGLVSPTAAMVGAAPALAGHAMSSPGLARALSGRTRFQQNPTVKKMAAELAKKYDMTAEAAAAWADRIINGEQNAPRQ